MIKRITLRGEKHQFFNYKREVKDPKVFRYMKILRFILRCIGAWPGNDLEEPSNKYELTPAYILIFVKVVTVFLMLLFLKIHSSSLSFLQIGHNYITLFMTFVSLSRLTTLSLTKKYRDVVRRFVTEMHLYYFRNNSVYAYENVKLAIFNTCQHCLHIRLIKRFKCYLKPYRRILDVRSLWNQMRETHVKMHKKSSFYTIYLKFLVFLGLLLFNSSPLYNNYKNGKFDFKNKNNISFEFAVYYALPFNTVTNLNGYIAVAIYNWFSVYICANIFCMFDLLLFLLVFHVNGHFKILIYTLNNFPKPTTLSNKEMHTLNDAQLYSHQEMIQIEKKLNECINYHRLLIKFTQEISQAFGPMLFFYYAFHQVSGCILLLEISQMKPAAIIKYGPLTLVLFQQLIQVSYIIESIGTVTGQLKDAVYGMPWEYMNTKNRKTLMIFLINVQEPLHVNALGLAKVGVTSMAAIIKTSLSYFAFLRSVAE